MLGPHRLQRTGKSQFIAWQANRRGGLVQVRVEGDRATLGGQATLISRIEWLADIASS